MSTAGVRSAGRVPAEQRIDRSPPRENVNGSEVEANERTSERAILGIGAATQRAAPHRAAAIAISLEDTPRAHTRAVDDEGRQRRAHYLTNERASADSPAMEVTTSCRCFVSLSTFLTLFLFLSHDVLQNDGRTTSMVPRARSISPHTAVYSTPAAARKYGDRKRTRSRNGAIVRRSKQNLPLLLLLLLSLFLLHLFAGYGFSHTNSWRRY